MKEHLKPAPHYRTRQDDLASVLGIQRVPGQPSAPARVLARRAQVGVVQSHQILEEVCTVFESPRLTPEQLLDAVRHFRAMTVQAQDVRRLPRTLAGLRAIAAAEHAVSVAQEALEVIVQTAGRGGYPLAVWQLLTMESHYRAAAHGVEQPDSPSHRATCYGRRAEILAQLETVCFAITQAPPLNQRH